MLKNNVYLLSGIDSYICKQSINKIIETHQIEFESIETYDMEETSMDEALSSAMTIPFLTDLKAVVISNVYPLGTTKPQKELNIDIEALQKYVENPNPSTILIILVPSEKLDSRKNIVKLISDRSETVTCIKTENEDLYGKIKNIIREHNLSIDANALQQFLSRVGSDPRNMENELDKLILFSEGKSKIDIQMVREVTSRNLEENIFSLVNAILANDRQTIMSIYQDLIKSNVDPIWMIGVVMNKFQEILYTKEMLRLNRSFDDIMKYFQASKGRVYYMVKNAKETDETVLYDYFSRLEKLDYEIKSGVIDKTLGFELFLLQSVESR